MDLLRPNMVAGLSVRFALTSICFNSRYSAAIGQRPFPLSGGVSADDGRSNSGHGNTIYRYADLCMARHDSVVEKDGKREDGFSVKDDREA